MMRSVAGLQAVSLACSILVGCGVEPAVGTGDAFASPIDVSTNDDARPATLTYEGLIQPIYIEWCADCHSGDHPDECSGGTCFVDIYEHLLVPSASKACDSELNVAECGLYRIEAAKDPNDPQNLIGLNGPIILPDAEVELLRTWIYSIGMPQR